MSSLVDIMHAVSIMTSHKPEGSELSIIAVYADEWGGGWRARKDIIAQQRTCYAYRPCAYFTVIAVIHHQLYILLRDDDHIVIINTTNGRVEGCIINTYFFPCNMIYGL